ncbi:hypothetical protein M436DRAFT_64001 [Aureobasidium namibiae CBS 147.97]|uniref:Uncharacterized protein n=1 Tax=Aureobasidium namibiae CBS 147.97 TaxID=1043004 RepID=A0A074WMJ5_9PEZI|nr:uncharacterized protein M436DRAFT_64001 [Aureobasidium namibiae CBS 147.97]KEQ72824.1 hypothetical protein M436DRAFT_64001 [Aureobasidium namibiae CBS 147.97]
MCLVGRPMSVMAPESVGERRQSAASLAKKIAEWTRTMLIRRKLASIETGFGTGPPNPSQYKLIFDVVEEAYESDKTAISRVLKGVRDEAISVQLDANRRIDVKLHLYEWLANSAPASLTDNRLSHAREEVCRMIGPNFRVLKYEAAMKNNSSVYDKIKDKLPPAGSVTHVRVQRLIEALPNYSLPDGSGNQLSKNQLKKRCKFVLACIKGEPVAEPTLAQTGAAKRASDADTAAATGPGKAPPNKRTSNLKTKKSSKSAHEKQHHTATVTSSSAPAASLPAPSMPDGVTAEWIANLVARVQEDTNARFFINYPNNYQTPRDASTPTGGFNPMPSGFGSDSFTSPNMHNAPHAFNGPSPHTPHNLHNPHSQPKSTYGYGLTMPLGSGQGSFTSRDFLPMPSAFSGPPPSMQYGHDQTKPSGLHTGSFTSRDFLQLPSVNRYGYDQSKPSGLHTDSPTSPDFLQTPSLNQYGHDSTMPSGVETR